jgi:hypothetical protein
MYLNLLLAASNVINTFCYFSIAYKRASAFQYVNANINKGSSVALLGSPQKYYRAL